jgi:RNA polymerase sigma-70 factor (ECF subfamily)
VQERANRVGVTAVTIVPAARYSFGMDPETERALVARLAGGDAGALAEVHAAFNTRLFTFLVRLARNRDVAEDLLEDTWLRLVKHARSLRRDTNLGAWLFTVARSRYYSHCRSRLLEVSHAADLIGLWPTPSPRVSPFERTAAGETERRIEAALASLPLIYREALLLVGVEGLSPAEAAAICGVTPETLRQRLHRARALLARRLEPAQPFASTRTREVTP